jgi:two-component system OmpR family response regulator
MLHTRERRALADKSCVTSGSGHLGLMVALVASVFVAILLLIWRHRRTVSPVSALNLDTTRVRDGVRPRAPEDAAPGGALVLRPHPLRALATRLEPASRLIGARGMIVWGVADAGRQLEVLAGFGYSNAFLARLGPLSTEARVLTALACAEGRPRTRPRGGSRLAAMAVPMERDGAVVGVLTAEFEPASGDRVPPDADAIVRLLATQMTPVVAAQQSAARLLTAGALRQQESVQAALPESRPKLALVSSTALMAAAGGSAAPVVAPPETARAPVGPEFTNGRILAVPSPRVVVLGALPDRPASPVPSVASNPGRERAASGGMTTTTVGAAATLRPPGALPDSPPASALAEFDSESSLREARGRFIAGFRKRCASIDELLGDVESKGPDGPLLALKQIVHRLSGLAAIVGLPTVGARAAELDRMLETPQTAARDTAGVRRAFRAMQEAFAADLGRESTKWAAASGASVGAHVLLVTSDASQAARMVEDLQGAGYRVTLTAQGLRAMTQAAADRPDVILLDVELAGDLDGHDVCRRIKAEPALANIPIVLVASHASTADRMAGFALGADDYLVKPVTSVELRLRVRWTLTRPGDRLPAPRAGGGLMAAEPFVAAAREVLRQGPAALGLVRVAPGAMTDLAAIFNDDLRRKDLLGRYSETQLAVLMPGASAGAAARRIGGVLDIARAAGVAQACAGVAATGLSTDRFIEPMLAEAESALAAAQVEGTSIVVYGAGAAAERGSVLIVDDDPDVVHIIDARLKAAGLQTLVAFDGQQALHQVETSAPAVVVLELMLPKRSGFDVLARLREAPEPRPRVVVVSSRSREEDVMRAFELGADDYLTKPFNPQELLARLARLLK